MNNMGQLSMGQRLNIEIHKNGEVLANCYYHWSAYTYSASNMAQAIVANYTNNKEKLEKFTDVEKAVFLFLSIGTGAGILENEFDSFKTDHPELKVKATDRNGGLISITEEGIEDTRNWQEGGVDIDIGTEEVNFDVINGVDEDELDEWFGDSDRVFHEFPAPSLLMSFDEFNTFADVIKKDYSESELIVYKAKEGMDFPYYVAIE